MDHGTFWLYHIEDHVLSCQTGVVDDDALPIMITTLNRRHAQPDNNRVAKIV
jgi:hypothetical protein